MSRRLTSWVFLIFTVLLGLGACGCAGNAPYSPVRSDFVEFSAEQKAEIASSSRHEYRLQQDDILRVAVSQQKDLNQEGVLVLPDGSIGLLGLDRLVVEGLTVSEADSVITAAYSTEYRDPQISVIVRETKGRQVYVLGEVRNPGIQRLPRGGVSIVGAVTLAGGFTDGAAPEGTALVRISNDGYLVQEIDLSSFNSVEGIGVALVELEPFDVVYVPRSRIGDFGYFAKTVLSGMVHITRMASDIKFLSTGSTGRF